MFGEPKKSRAPLARQPDEFKRFLEDFRKEYAREERKPIPSNTDAQRILAEKAIHPYMDLNEAAKRIGQTKFKLPRL